MIDTLAPEYLVGLAAVQQAATLCESVRRQMGADDRLQKADDSPVTVADFGAQAIVCLMVGNAFPDDAIVGEEDSSVLRDPAHHATLEAVRTYVESSGVAGSSEEICAWIDRGTGEPVGRYWVLDPLDGTKGFLRGDQYAVALALMAEDQPQWAFLACPALDYLEQAGVIFVAQRGAGAAALTLTGDLLGPLQVSTTPTPTAARMTESVEVIHKHHGLAHRTKERLGMRFDSLLVDSQAKYGIVASGQADVYLRAPNPRTPNYRENIWDHAAGWLVVQEAGGVVTDITGQLLDWTQGRKLAANVGIVASNGQFHQQIIEAVAHIRQATA